MPTPNSPDAPAVDIHSDPEFNEQFGTNVGEEVESATAMAGSSAAFDETALIPTTQNGGRMHNVGRTEQKIRIVTGAAMVAAAAFAPIGRNWRIALGAIGAAELLTGSMRYCPLWHSLGINTNQDRQR